MKSAIQNPPQVTLDGRKALVVSQCFKPRDLPACIAEISSQGWTLLSAPSNFKTPPSVVI